ncbi:MAG: hypothetical protein SAJ12_01690 [Jaaginema sp. PMC 1079.18]|nr:hypothetical protein [Jaaginema sp. PMC 1080.18]MEC4849698.1 hypothetical protein [Jaaginema sp. PMC 1079.18]MEC4864873.1 hypothetical protein [Jaaginema sp. PMC 1078.18]
MKYFFLPEDWTVGRVWEFGGLWDEISWRRKPQIQRLNIAIVEQGESLWLYQVEDAVLMIEVTPNAQASQRTIGQVVLKRLITAENAMLRLSGADAIANQLPK